MISLPVWLVWAMGIGDVVGAITLIFVFLALKGLRG